MNSDMDNQKSSPRDITADHSWQQWQQDLFGDIDVFAADIYPDQSQETEMDPLLVENFGVDLSPEINIEEELSESMNSINGIEARFQTLLKSRLLQEIESRPPRFPWENGSELYLAEESLGQSPLGLPLLQPQWVALNLPFNLPDTVLANLMQACSQAMQSLEPQGVKLVQAVQELFPVDKLMLHQLAQWVMAAPQPSRSGQGAVLTGDFATANEQQRVAMSMIAAKTIMDRLMISLSSTQPSGALSWETTVGKIEVRATLLSQESAEIAQEIQVAIALPKGGEAVWESPQGSARASRMYPGELRLNLMDCQGQGIYPITIRLHQAEQEPLTVAIARQ